MPSISVAQQAAMRKNQEEILKQQENLRKTAELKQMIDGLEKVNDEARRGSLLDNLYSTEDVLSLPVHPDPPGIKKGNLKVDLLKHQVCGLVSEIRENTEVDKIVPSFTMVYWTRTPSSATEGK